MAATTAVKENNQYQCIQYIKENPVVLIVALAVIAAACALIPIYPVDITTKYILGGCGGGLVVINLVALLCIFGETKRRDVSNLSFASIISKAPTNAKSCQVSPVKRAPIIQSPAISISVVSSIHPSPVSSILTVSSVHSTPPAGLTPPLPPRTAPISAMEKALDDLLSKTIVHTCGESEKVHEILQRNQITKVVGGKITYWFRVQHNLQQAYIGGYPDGDNLSFVLYHFLSTNDGVNCTTSDYEWDTDSVDEEVEKILKKTHTKYQLN